MNSSGLERGWLVMAFLAAIAVTGCADLGADPAPDESISPPPLSSTEQVSFQTQVRPILQSYACLSCHGSSGGLSVASVSDLLRGGEHGPAIVPGKPESSVLIAKLSSAPPFGSRMPQGGPPLADSVVQVLRLWLSQGAKNN